MREMRIMLPDELWEKFDGFTPQKMKDMIRVTICMHYGISPEKREHKLNAKKPEKTVRNGNGQFISPAMRHRHSKEGNAPPGRVETWNGMNEIEDGTVMCSEAEVPPSITKSTGLPVSYTPAKTVTAQPDPLTSTAEIIRALPITNQAVAHQPQTGAADRPMPEEIAKPATSRTSAQQIPEGMPITIPKHKKIKMSDEFMSAL